MCTKKLPGSINTTKNKTGVRELARLEIAQEAARELRQHQEKTLERDPCVRVRTGRVILQAFLREVRR